MPAGQPYVTLNNIGICRIAFGVDDIDRTYADLQAKKVQFVAPLKKIKRPDGATIGVVCFKRGEFHREPFAPDAPCASPPAFSNRMHTFPSNATFQSGSCRRA